MNDNFYRLLRSRFPDENSQPCLQTPSRLYSYAEAEQAAARFANALLQEGLVKGDRILVQVHKSPQSLFLYLGCLQAGLIYVPLNTAYTSTELQYFLTDAEPGMVVCDPGNFQQMSKLASRQNQRPVVRTLNENGEGDLAVAARAASCRTEITSCTKNDVAVIIYYIGYHWRAEGRP